MRTLHERYIRHVQVASDLKTIRYFVRMCTGSLEVSARRTVDGHVMAAIITADHNVRALITNEWRPLGPLFFLARDVVFVRVIPKYGGQVKQHVNSHFQFDLKSAI